jgi:RHS repeat-associated protein
VTVQRADGSVKPEEYRLGNRHTYTGRLVERDTGLLQYRHRYLSPTLGRFVQRDPLGYVDGMSQVAYAASSPLAFLDPFGLTVRTYPKGHKDGKFDPFRDALENMLNEACPGAKVNDDGSITAPPPPQCDETSNDWCERDPPGCRILRQLTDSERVYNIAVRKGGKFIPFPRGRRDESDLLIPLRSSPMNNGRMPWEELWHEIIHGLRRDLGEVQRGQDNREGQPGWNAEEILTIIANNHLRKWKRECNPNDPKNPGFPALFPWDHKNLPKYDDFGGPLKRDWKKEEWRRKHWPEEWEWLTPGEWMTNAP